MKAILQFLPQADRCISRKCPSNGRSGRQLWLPPLLFLLLNMMLYALKHPFCDFKSAFPVVILPNPHPTYYRVGGKKGKALTCCKHCSAIAKTLVSTLFQSQIQTKHFMRKVNSIPAHPYCLNCSNGTYDGVGRVLGQNSLQASMGIKWSL